MAVAGVQEAASSMFGCSYYVVLSFKGKDACKTFVDQLYTALMHGGICTFRNDGEHKRGENIETAQQKAIKESRISIIIFSKGYASSKRCLDELVNILERKKTAGHMILPVFYDVDPSHVRKQTGSYEKAFLRHEEELIAEIDERKREGIAKVQRWRDSLEEVANLAGMVLEDGHESDLIHMIVEETWNKLNRTVLSVVPYPIGIGSRVRDINLWLQDESTGVGIMMIYGTGGIGKTTIAKTVYALNFERFERSSFLADIRETSRRSNGSVHLQKRLLSDTLEEKVEKVRSATEGVNKIRELLCCKKLLLLLDDVDQVEQLHAVLGRLDWFRSGSKIVITTRQERLLKAYETCFMYKVKELDCCESLQLFSWHAFGQDQPMKGYINHSKRILNHCRGIPLALQVLGSSLSGGSLDLFENALGKVEEISDPQIFKVIDKL